MKLFTSLTLCCVLFFSAGAHAADAFPGMANVVEVGVSHDTLNNGYANWDSRYVDGAHRFGERHTVYGELRETQRFKLQDREISGGY